MTRNVITRLSSVAFGQSRIRRVSTSSLRRIPKATPQSNARFGRRVVDMPTASLVRGSSLVLCHYTTAVSFPVIFRKPVLFLTSDKMETNASGVMVARLSSWLGSRRINIDHLPARLSIPGGRGELP